MRAALWVPIALALAAAVPVWGAEPVYVPPAVQARKLVHRVEPVLPMTAKAHHLSGLVTMRVQIAADGTVSTVQVISGHTLLTGAAINAVKRWRYRETLLGPNPVEVVTTVDVWVGPSVGPAKPPRGVEAVVYKA